MFLLVYRGQEYSESPAPEEGISKEHGQVRTPLSHGNSLLFCLPSKRRLSCQNVGPGPDWSVEWIFTSLISATANRQSSKGRRQNRGGRGVRRLQDHFTWIRQCGAGGLVPRASWHAILQTPHNALQQVQTHMLIYSAVASKHTDLMFHFTPTATLTLTYVGL